MINTNELFKAVKNWVKSGRLLCGKEENKYQFCNGYVAVELPICEVPEAMIAFLFGTFRTEPEASFS